MKRKLLVLLMAMVMIFTACSGGSNNEVVETPPEDPTATTEEVADAADGTDTAEAPEANDGESTTATAGGQYLNTWYQEEPTTLNSAKGSDASSYEILKNIQEPLIRLVEQEDGTLEITPAGAESWETSEDGLTWTFKIREGNNWTNGDPVTAKDYEFGIKTSLIPANYSEGMGWLLDVIEGANTEEPKVVATDETTLEITLVRPTGYFLSLASLRPMLPIHQGAYEANPENYGAEVDTIEMSGPFKVTEWTHQTELKLERNENYWDAANVPLDNISWRIINEENTRYNAFLNNELDTVGTTIAEWEEQFKAIDNVEQNTFPGPSMTYFFFNTEAKPFNNPKVRLAFSAAFNREEAVAGLLNGIGIPAYGWVTPAITNGEGKEYREVVKDPFKEVLDAVEDPRALLEEGLAEEGMTIEEFNPRFDIGGTSTQMREWGDYYIATIQNALGVELNLSLSEWSAFSAQVNEGDFEIAQMGWFADYNDPYHMMSLLLSDVNGVLTRYSNPEYDALVQEAVKEEDPVKQTELYEEAELMLAEESPVIPMWFAINNIFRYDYIDGMAYNPFNTQGLRYVDTSARP